ncbi:hypothetical protein GIB67_019438 [Kingdonia uniflora]|uniref:Uncharacterized protein n=1 Tax=Kingdonia uniflora TaxID=39325 RepID=A0A7J7MU05_9MAGN|nr:hypothetical protein GIB67_019438 [Kingdonia uniflora]
MESVQLEHENVTELVLVTFGDGVEEGRRFLNEEKDPMTSKELNVEQYEVKISCKKRATNGVGEIARRHGGHDQGTPAQITANPRQQNALPAASRISVHDRLGHQGRNTALPQIQQEPVLPRSHINLPLPAGAVIDLQPQEEQNREKPRVSVYDRMEEATGEYNPARGPTTRRAVMSRQHLTPEQVDKCIKELLDAQILNGRSNYARLQNSMLAQELLDEEVPTSFHTPTIQKYEGGILWNTSKNFKIPWDCIPHPTTSSAVYSRLA